MDRRGSEGENGPGLLCRLKFIPCRVFIRRGIDYIYRLRVIATQIYCLKDGEILFDVDGKVKRESPPLDTVTIRYGRSGIPTTALRPSIIPVRGTGDWRTPDIPARLHPSTKFRVLVGSMMPKYRVSGNMAQAGGRPGINQIDNADKVRQGQIGRRLKDGKIKPTQAI